jgi:hypothetical protein
MLSGDHIHPPIHPHGGGTSGDLGHTMSLMPGVNRSAGDPTTDFIYCGPPGRNIQCNPFIRQPPSILFHAALVHRISNRVVIQGKPSLRPFLVFLFFPPTSVRHKSKNEIKRPPRSPIWMSALAFRSPTFQNHLWFRVTYNSNGSFQ